MENKAKTDEMGGTVEIPMGMAMTMAQDPEAMKAFCRLSEPSRAKLISKARSVKSREEMTRLISELTRGG